MRKNIVFQLLLFVFFVWLEFWNIKILAVAIQTFLHEGLSILPQIAIVTIYGSYCSYKAARKAFREVIRRWWRARDSNP